MPRPPSPHTDALEVGEAFPALRGHAWVCGDHISADAVLPPSYRETLLAELPRLAMTGVCPSFLSEIASGDFVVAGLEFAHGPAHKLTATALQRAGVAAVIARSFGAVFAVAATNVGLPALVIEEAGAIKAGDRLRVDIEASKIVNLSSGDRYIIRNLSDATLAVLRAGGLTEYTRRHAR